MMSQKVVLSGPRADHEDEVELGPFSQGVVFDSNGQSGMCALIDIATGDEIAALEQHLGWILKNKTGPMLFNLLFVQTYPEESS